MPSAAPGTDSLIGQTLGHYRIVAKIGAGGMGEVYRALDEHLEREVAIKVLPQGTLVDESARRQFRNEALALSRLNHPNIATVYDFDTQLGLDFLVMEYIRGVTLSDKLLHSSLPQHQVIALGVQLAEGLSAAHAHAVVHRDLKPGNLRVTDDGRLKVLDFGLAKLRLAGGAAPASETLSDAHHLVGTLPYMAPEQVMGGDIDERTDIHAAGAVLYEMTTGQRPFANVDRSELIVAILRSSPEAAAVVNPKTPPELDRIIRKCLEKDMEERYQSARELALDLRRLARDKEVATPAHPNSSGMLYFTFSKHKTALFLGGGLLFVMFVAAILLPRLIRRTPGSPLPSVAASIAVLPFADLSATQNHEYFCEGLAEEILDKLTKIPDLKVAGRTSAFQFKGQNKDLRAIGQTLHVADILEGSVQRDGNRVRITVHLTQADAGLSLWSERYGAASRRPAISSLKRPMPARHSPFYRYRNQRRRILLKRIAPQHHQIRHFPCF